MFEELIIWGPQVADEHDTLAQVTNHQPCWWFAIGPTGPMLLFRLKAVRQTAILFRFRLKAVR